MNKSRFSGDSSRDTGAADGVAKARRSSNSGPRQQHSDTQTKRQQADRPSGEHKPYSAQKRHTESHSSGERPPRKEQKYRGDKHSRNDRQNQGEYKHRDEAQAAAQRGAPRRGHDDARTAYGRNADIQDSRKAQDNRKAQDTQKAQGRRDNRAGRGSDYATSQRSEAVARGRDNRRAEAGTDARKFERPAREFADTRSQSSWGSQRRAEATEFDASPAKGFDEKEQRLNETRLYGINACRETFKYRRDEVIKLYLDKETAPQFADVMKHLARTRKAYHVVESDELERIVGSQHHGGVVMVVRRKPVSEMGAYLARERNKSRDCLLALDGVGNPHNLGAIMRSCAHFGISGIVMTEAGLLQSGAAARTAEGGMEHVEGISTARLTDALQACREAGYTIITTSSHGGASLYASKLPAKVVVVFGEEMDGVSKAVASRADIGVQIPGSGLVESLNVSVAASLILGEWYRQQL